VKVGGAPPHVQTARQQSVGGESAQRALLHYCPDARNSLPDLGLAAQRLLVLQHHGPDGQASRVALRQHFRRARKGIRQLHGIVRAGGRLSLALDEAAAYRVVDLLPQDRARAVEGCEAHAVRMAGQYDVAAKEQVAGFIERDRRAAHKNDALALADAAHQTVDARRIDPIRLLSQQSQDDRAIGTVAAAGQSERAVQLDLDSGGRAVEGRGKRSGGAHGTDRVRTRRSDPDFE